MFTVFSSFDIIGLLLISFLFIGCDSAIALLGLWIVYFLAGLWFNNWTFIQMWGWMGSHAFDILMYIIGYLVIGALWSVFKWYLFVVKSAEEYKKVITAYLAMQNPARSWPDYLRNTFVRYPPNVGDYKGKIVNWISFWWYSMIQTILGDWMHKLVVAVYDMFLNIYETIVKRVYSGIETPK